MNKHVLTAILIGVVLTPAAIVLSCATVPGLHMGAVVDRPGLGTAQGLVWGEAYGRTDLAPLVYVVEGDELTCKDPFSGLPGFECPTVGCRNGCTGSPTAIHISTADTWAGSTLAHEDMHALLIRRNIARLGKMPTSFGEIANLGDRNHTGPEWLPGGDVDRACALLASHGL